MPDTPDHHLPKCVVGKGKPELTQKLKAALASENYEDSEGSWEASQTHNIHSTCL